MHFPFFLGLCGDLAHLESVLLVIACSNYQSINLLSARPTTLSTIIIDCDQQTSEVGKTPFYIFSLFAVISLACMKHGLLI